MSTYENEVRNGKFRPKGIGRRGKNGAASVQNQGSTLPLYFVYTTRHMPRAVLPAKDFAHRPLFLLWTDALCFREMAKEAPDKYLESMCIRNAVLSAWTSLEMACCDALGVKKIKGGK